jgi:hypothetical protein
MKIDYIELEGKKYPFREVNGYLFATESLWNVISDENGALDIYADIYSKFTWFLPEEEFLTLNDARLWKEYQTHT